MIVDYLTKMANLLDTVGTSPARQAAEGIDSVIYSLAAGTPLVDMYQVLRNAENQLGELRQEALAAQQEFPNMEKYLDTIIGNMNKVRNAIEKSPDFTKGLEKKFPRIDEVQEGTSQTVPLRPEQTEVNEFGGEEGSWSMGQLPQSRQSSLLSKLTKVANLLDEEGHVEAADILDGIVKDATELPDYPTRMETREELYNAPKHNNETMWEITKDEVRENRKQHHLETMRPTARSLMTRYSPELPGVQMLRVSDGVYQDFLTKEIYDFNSGWVGRDGLQHPGGSVKNQTPNLTQYAPPSRLFDGSALAGNNRN